MHIVAGAVIRRDSKYLLVQEAMKKCYGLWNVPAGHADIGETILEAAKREVKEETGYEVELTGVCQVGNFVWTNDSAVTVIFTADIVSGELSYPEDEMLDAKWFTYDEIHRMRDQLRAPNLIIGAIDAVEHNQVSSLDLVAITRVSEPR